MRTPFIVAALAAFLAAGIALGEAQPGSAIGAEAADQKNAPSASVTVICTDDAGNIVIITGIYIRGCIPPRGRTAALSPRPPVPAKIGEGAFSGPGGNILRTLEVRPLDQIGEDVIRFSDTPSLIGGGWVLELHRDGQGASGTRRTLPREGLARVEQALTVPISMSRAEYDALAAQFDMLMARNEPDMRVDEESVEGCADGPSYVAERRSGGRSTWRNGSCDGPREDHPNSAIAKLLAHIGA